MAVSSMMGRRPPDVQINNDVEAGRRRPQRLRSGPARSRLTTAPRNRVWTTLPPYVILTRGDAEPLGPLRRGSGTKRAGCRDLWNVSQQGRTELSRKGGDRVLFGLLNNTQRACRSTNTANGAQLIYGGTRVKVRRWVQPLVKTSTNHAQRKMK